GTSTARPLARLVTRTRLPRGRVRCAPVSAYMSNTSPLAVFLPWWGSPYHDALPVCTTRGSGGVARATDGGRVVAAPTVSPRAGAHPAVASASAISGAASRGIDSTTPPRDRRGRHALDSSRARCRRETPPCPFAGRSGSPPY